MKMRIFAMAAMILALSNVGAVRAADTSKIHVATFAYEGRNFVLIEKGFSDGLGAPFVNAYAVDVTQDKWLDGFPVKLSMNESEVREFEEATPGDFNSASKKMMQKVMDETVSSSALKRALENPSQTSERVSNTAWELSAPKLTARFTLNDYIPSSNKAWKLELTELDFPAGENCYGFTDKMKGFRLILVDEKGGVERELNNDLRIPKSRGCALGYSLANVYSHRHTNGMTSLAVVLRYSKPGFEGADRRLMVVTRQLPKQ